jgi:glycosyltransferase involved in cell wall biosynthesis
VPAVIEPFTFLLVARLLREKGILEYVEAARLVKAKYPKVRFILLGALDVNPSSLTQKELDSWVSEGLLEWPGHVAVQPWLTQTSVFVLPSYREGLPRSTQEAMAMARPVITTDVPGCRETVIENVNGFLVPARDSAALAQAMFKFVEQPDLVGPMGQQSRLMAEMYFDGQQKTQDLISILRLAPLN